MNVKEYNTAVELYADHVYRFVLKHLKDEMASRDVVQDSFMKVWDKHEDVTFEKAKSYLFTTAYHTMLNWIKKEKRNVGIEQAEPQISYNTGSNFDLQATLNWALEKLPEIQKTVVLLRDYEGYAYDEIAEITKLNESQVKVYIFRARKSLQQILKTTDLVA